MSISDHRWVAKAISQKAISKLGLLPVYHAGQKVAGRLKHFSAMSRIEYAGKLAADVGLDRVIGATLVEIGTGWVPVVPAGLHLLGAKEIHSFDLSRHLQDDLVQTLARQLPDCVADLSKRTGHPASGLLTRARYLQNAPDDLLGLIRLHYHAPYDFTSSGLEDESVDIVYSNLVLEHVTPEALGGILRESRRILKPGGVCWHNVDFTDHYSHTHRGLSHVNFLRYGARFWELVGQNDILYMNRMRRSDYIRAFEQAGFVIEARHDHHIMGGADLPIHPDFAGYPPDEIACSASRFVLRKS